MTEPELYDLKNDIAQKHNLAKQKTEKVEALTAEQEAVRKSGK